MYDLAIIGGGPAGVAAGVYASRKKLKTVLLTKDFGGQSTVSDNIQNWIGTISISGNDLAKNLKAHLQAYASDVLDIKEGEFVEKITGTDGNFRIKTSKGEHSAKTVLLSAGSHRRKLLVPGAEKFENKGITYCASCDGPLFTDMDVAVIGGGNAAFETAAQLLAYTKSVTLFEGNNTFKADPVTVEKVTLDPKMHGLRNVEVLEITGDKFVSGIMYKEKSSGEVKTIAVQGIFVEIGATPTTEFAKDLISLNKYNQVVVDPKNQRSSLVGIWAAGDCTDGLYHQNNIAAGDAVKALEDIYLHLRAK